MTELSGEHFEALFGYVISGPKGEVHVQDSTVDDVLYALKEAIDLIEDLGGTVDEMRQKVRRWRGEWAG